MNKKFPLSKVNASVFGAFHVVAAIELFSPTWDRVLLTLCYAFISGCLGVTMTYHRFLTHGGFKTYRFLERFFALCGCLGLQGPPGKWVATHWKHHMFAEKSGLDPHTPNDGGWWAHMAWLLYPDPKLKHEDEMKRYAPYLFKQQFYRTLQKIFWVPSTVWGLTCLYFGGMHAVGWGLAIPVVFGWHFTWLINSGTHMWGSRRFETDDDSRNSWWIALFTFGEGWHNNHHANPVSARHGAVWWEIDPTYYTIKTLQFFGLVWDVKDWPKTTATS